MRNIAALNKHITNLLAQAEQRTGRNQTEQRAIIYLPVKDNEPAIESEKGYGSYRVHFFVPEHRLNEGHHEPTEPIQTDIG